MLLPNLVSMISGCLFAAIHIFLKKNPNCQPKIISMLQSKINSFGNILSRVDSESMEPAPWRCRFQACCLRHGANATTKCDAGAAHVALVLVAPGVCAPGDLLRCAAPRPAAPAPPGAAMQMGCDGDRAGAGAAAAPARRPHDRRASIDAFMVAYNGTPLPRAALGACVEPV